jgi:hypothetical protein
MLIGVTKNNRILLSIMAAIVVVYLSSVLLSIFYLELSISNGK